MREPGQSLFSSSFPKPREGNFLEKFLATGEVVTDHAPRPPCSGDQPHLSTGLPSVCARTHASTHARKHARTQAHGSREGLARRAAEAVFQVPERALRAPPVPRNPLRQGCVVWVRCLGPGAEEEGRSTVRGSHRPFGELNAFLLRRQEAVAPSCQTHVGRSGPTPAASQLAVFLCGRHSCAR